MLEQLYSFSPLTNSKSLYNQRNFSLLEYVVTSMILNTCPVSLISFSESEFSRKVANSKFFVDNIHGSVCINIALSVLQRRYKVLKSFKSFQS